MDTALKVAGAVTGVIILVFAALFACSAAAGFARRLRQKAENYRTKIYRVRYVQLCTYSGKKRELMTYDLSLNEMAYFVKAKQPEQAVAKLMKNLHISNPILISGINVISPDK